MSQDPKAGKYSREYGLEFAIARLALEGEPGTLAWGMHDYEAMVFNGPAVRLIFYPHRTSAGNYHLRVRDQASKDKKRAALLIARLQVASGHWCTFQSSSVDQNKAHEVAKRDGREFGWARTIATAKHKGK